MASGRPPQFTHRHLKKQQNRDDLTVSQRQGTAVTYGLAHKATMVSTVWPHSGSTYRPLSVRDLLSPKPWVIQNAFSPFYKQQAGSGQTHLKF